MVVINISVINCFQKVITKAFAGFVVEIVGVETYRTCRVGLSHIFHYIGYDAEFLFGTFRVGIQIVELHFIVHSPEEYGRMISVLFHHAQPFTAPKIEHAFVRYRGGVYHEPRPSALKADSDTVAVCCRHPKFVPGGGMCPGRLYIPFFHQFHELVCKERIIGTERKRNMVTSTQPIFAAVQIKESIFAFKRAEPRSYGDAVRHFVFSFRQAHAKIIKIRSGRFPKFGFQSFDITGKCFLCACR